MTAATRMDAPSLPDRQLSQVGQHAHWAGSLPGSSDLRALAALYRSLGGARWMNRTGWLGDPDACEWAGVKCDGNGRVVGLQHLRGSRGSVPTQLGRLDALDSLDLSDNALLGWLPREMCAAPWRPRTRQRLPIVLAARGRGRLTKLRWLYAKGNLLSGTLPAELAATGALLRLSAWNNPRLSGTLPTELGRHMKLFYLWLRHDALSGTLPTQLGRLTQLRTVYLGQQHISGVLPTELALAGGADYFNHPMGLKYLGLEENAISGSPRGSIRRAICRPRPSGASGSPLSARWRPVLCSRPCSKSRPCDWQARCPRSSARSPTSSWPSS